MRWRNSPSPLNGCHGDGRVSPVSSDPALPWRHCRNRYSKLLIKGSLRFRLRHEVVSAVVSSRPRAGLGRVLDDLGGTFLELAYGNIDRARELGGIAFHDPIDTPVLPPSALVLGVGVGGDSEVIRLLNELQGKAAALVVRSPVPTGRPVIAAVADTGVALLGLARGATWSQLAAMLSSLLGESDVGVVEPESLGGMPSGDLFALANAIAAMLDAPITIEDRSSRVLAFSGRQDEADESRVQTILGLQVPEQYARPLAERGVFRELYRSHRPVVVEPLSSGEFFSVPRVAIAVRAGDEVLGSIWAAARTRFDERRTEALCEAATLVALHLLRVRAGADVERRLRADLVSTALEGGASAREALNRLRLADQPVVVLALASREPAEAEGGAGDEAVRASQSQRLSDAFALHLSAAHPRSAAALVGRATYGLVPSRDGGEGTERAVRIATEFVGRLGDRFQAVVAVGPSADTVAGLARARVSADRTLRVLREGSTGYQVAQESDVYVAALMLEVCDLVAARGDTLSGPVGRLLDYDARHRTKLVETLDAWLNALGDVTAAASAVYVHPNTFRYRLRRLAEVGGLDLSDPEARFAALVQLRIIAGQR